MNIESKISLIITLGRSLLGEVTESLRAAAVRVEASVIYVSFFFNTDVTEEMIDHYEFAYSEVSAPVPLEVFGPVLYEKKIFPEPLPDVGLYVFSRDTLFMKQVDQQDLIGHPLGIRIKIALYQALLGRIPQKLRAVRFENKMDTLTVIFSMDLAIETADLDLLNQALSELMNEFPNLIVKHDFEIGKILPQISGYVFRRYAEPLNNEFKLN